MRRTVSLLFLLAALASCADNTPARDFKTMKPKVLRAQLDSISMACNSRDTNTLASFCRFPLENTRARGFYDVDPRSPLTRAEFGTNYKGIYPPVLVGCLFDIDTEKLLRTGSDTTRVRDSRHDPHYIIATVDSTLLTLDFHADYTAGETFVNDRWELRYFLENGRLQLRRFVRDCQPTHVH